MFKINIRAVHFKVPRPFCVRRIFSGSIDRRLFIRICAALTQLSAARHVAIDNNNKICTRAEGYA